MSRLFLLFLSCSLVCVHASEPSTRATLIQPQHDMEMEPEGKTLHNNRFYFDSNGTVTVQFAVNRTVITGGQPYEGVTCDGNRVTVRGECCEIHA